ncbi:MAG TPA: hypothetical protein PKI34_00445 [Bacteroidales bacterium]|nr:hypothetical protein [Bacteroidales bacterium]
MTNREKIKMDISTAFDFAEKVISEPEILDKISTGTTVDFLESGMEKHEKQTESKKRKYVRVKHQFEVL